ncbi:hypothetical protein EA772_11065 [Pedobacter sp. G11]|uniref:hypothetical protein n=1 Tax=Pedobacter sp. G11 TaxID=2482728 RepID=UPI000F5E368F|nr:hypothetical protein [Pedobacter sp. G11]AZI25856.1 hypothetical protein EA772_11065 [Pedobacter sp. G11]
MIDNMVSFFKRIIRPLLTTKAPVVEELKRDDNSIIYEWEKQGKPAPPPHIIKQKAILQAKKASGYNILIETGTYLGEMIESQKNTFRIIYSIELGHDLHIAAKAKFKKEAHINLLEGDSGKILKVLMPQIKEPAIFWLDGHYSGGITAKGDKDCPIFEELTAILNADKLPHILMIDDARLFNGADGYPTVAELNSFIRTFTTAFKQEIENDIISISLF